MPRAWLTIILSFGLALQVAAQGRFGVAFYDAERLYDTIPSRFYDDRDYTPTGRLRWDAERYDRKIKHTARVVDSLAMPVVVLYGVENEAVVRAIVSTCQQDYSYIHRTQDGSDGLDFAVLYFADWFIPEHITSWRGALCVEGSVRSHPLTIVAVWQSTSIGVLLEQRGLLDSERDLIIVGRPSGNSPSRYGLRDLAVDAERRGRGNVAGVGGWTMRDRAWTNFEGEARCEVYVAEWLLGRNSRPLPTYDRTRYYGGYGSALPVIAYFDEMFAY